MEMPNNRFRGSVYDSTSTSLYANSEVLHPESQEEPSPSPSEGQSAASPALARPFSAFIPSAGTWALRADELALLMTLQWEVAAGFRVQPVHPGARLRRRARSSSSAAGREGGREQNLVFYTGFKHLLTSGTQAGRTQKGVWK